MTSTEHSPKAPHSTGIFARLRAFLHTKGTGASSALLLALVVCAFVASPAFAGKQYISGPSFGAKGSGAGQLEDPEGIAVNDKTGDVYVADMGNRRIDEFTATGGFVMAFGKEVGSLGEDTCTVTCKAGASGSSPGEFEAPRFIAVDQATGDLYVEDTGDDLITKFSESGALIESWGNNGPGGTPNGQLNGSPAELFKELGGVAVSPSGDLWVRELAVNKNAKVDEFSETGVFEPGGTFFTPSGNYGVAVDSSGGVYVSGPNFGEKYESGMLVSQFSYHPSAFAVNLATNNVLTFKNEEGHTQVGEIQLFPPFAEPSAPIETFAASGESVSNGIAVNGEEADYPLYQTQFRSDTVVTYDYFQLPEVVSDPASSVEVEREAGHPSVVATLDGTVNPNGLPVTRCVFEYGPTTAYGHSAKCEQSLQEIGEGETAKPVTAKIANLLPSTTYHFRLRAVNADDESDPEAQIRHAGSDETFPTPGPSIVAEAPAAEVKATTATLSGEVNPGGLPLSKCEFEYGTKSEYEAIGLYEHSAPCEAPNAAEVGEGTVRVEVHADLKGLQGGTTYVFHLLATAEVFATKEQATVIGGGKELTTSQLAVLANEKAEHVTESGAELTATVNPEGLPVTRCAFEYVPAEQYEAAAPDPYARGRVVHCEQRLAQIGTGTEPVPVSAQITGLSPNVTYQWRLSVKDANGEALSPDHTFIYPTTGPELPDDRAYEMVSPPFKNGALIGRVFKGVPPDIAESGSRMIATSIQCFAPAESCPGLRGQSGEPFEFTRTPAGWTTTVLAPPATQFGENTAWKYSADAGTVLSSMPTGPKGEDEWYKREENGSFLPIGPVSEELGIESVKTGADIYATADLSHLAWSTDDAAHLYEYVGAHNKEPFLVGVTGTSGSTELVSACATELGGVEEEGHPWNAMSADGRTVYFTARGHDVGKDCRQGMQAPPVDELYARLDGGEPEAHTVAISQPDAPEILAEGSRGHASPPDDECESEECQKNISEPASWRDAKFAGASTDGSSVYFVDPQQLTDSATEGQGSAHEEGCSGSGSECNLYLYDFNRPAGHNLIDASAPEDGGVSPRVQGVVATSADGSHVYFVANGVLTSAANSVGSKAIAGDCRQIGNGAVGKCNLYMYERDARYPAGHLAFVASVPGSDWKNWREFKGNVHANVTPDGQFLVFESHGDLTPDDIRRDGSPQIFRYDAESEELVRISVGNEGFNDNGNGSDEMACEDEEVCPNAASIVRAFRTASSLGVSRGDPTMSNDGSYVFFQSPIALTPHALGDVPVAGGKGYAENVYEWHEGHVYLISDGSDVGSAETSCESPNTSSDVCLLGSDATGQNVFFTTSDQLVPKDTDTQVDYYDARICEPEQGNPCIAEPSPPLPPCNEEACHGIPAATPSLLAPGTASFNGEGNLAPTVSPPPKKVTKKAAKCKKVVVKKKGKRKTECLAKKTSKKAKKSSDKRVSRDRGTK